MPYSTYARLNSYLGQSNVYSQTTNNNNDIYYAAQQSGGTTIYKLDTSGNKTIFNQSINNFVISIAFDNNGFPNGRLYAACGSNGPIYSFDVSGNRTTFLSSTEMSYHFISGFEAYDTIAFDNNNNLYYTSNQYNKIYKVDTNKNKTVFINGSGVLSSPLGICFDKYNNIYICSNVNNNGYVSKYDSNGNMVRQNLINKNVNIYLVAFDYKVYNLIYVAYTSGPAVETCGVGVYDVNGGFYIDVGAPYSGYSSSGSSTFTFNSLSLDNKGNLYYPDPDSMFMWVYTPYYYNMNYWGFDSNFNKTIIYTQPVPHPGNTTSHSYTVLSYNNSLFTGYTLQNSRFQYWVDNLSNPTITYNVGDSINLTSDLNVYASFLQTTPCFLEGTKILCFKDNEECYIPIENIRKGTLVKTLLNGYLPVDMIGKKPINNPSHEERIEERLYRCPKENYPDLNEDLYITGFHSILVDDKDISDEEVEEIIKKVKYTYFTDGKVRLLACVDKRAVPYQEEGVFTVWHIALESDDYYINYGVYANGLLVETCSKRYLKELSKMELVY